MAEINDLSITDASNTARFPENQAPSTVNNGGRALEGIVARWFADTNGSVTTGGAADAQTFAANQTFTAYYTGMRLTFKAGFTNTGAITLDVDGLGAKDLNGSTGGPLGANGITTGVHYDVIYNGTEFRKLG